jgi:hypothetical protein
MASSFTRRRGHVGSLRVMETRNQNSSSTAVGPRPKEGGGVLGRNQALIEENKSLRELLRRRNAERAELLLRILGTEPLTTQKVHKSTQTTDKDDPPLLRAANVFVATPPFKGSYKKLASPPNIISIRKSPLPPKRGRGAAQGTNSLQGLVDTAVYK